MANEQPAIALWYLSELQKYTLFDFYWGLIPPRNGRKWECVYFNPSGGMAQIFEGKTAKEACLKAYDEVDKMMANQFNDQT